MRLDSLKAGPFLGSLGLHAAALGVAAVTGVSVARVGDSGVGAGPTGGGDGALAIVLSEPSAAGSTLVDDTLAGDVRPELLEASFPEVVLEPVEVDEPTTWLAEATAAAESEVEAEPESPDVAASSWMAELERSPTLALAGMRVGSRSARSQSHGDDAGAIAEGRSGVAREGEGLGSALPWLGAVGQTGTGGGGGLGTASGPGTGGGHGEAVTGPSLVEGPRPAYPRSSVRAEEEGTVVCRIHVAADGRVTSVDVVESSGHERLDRAAIEAIERWRFEPKRVDGRCMASSLVHRVTFRLESA